MRLAAWLCALAVAGCGHGGRSDPPRDPAPAPAPAPAPPPVPVPVVVVDAAVADAAGLTADECGRGCRNYATLSYWHKHERELAKVAAGKRAARRAEMDKDLAALIDAGLSMCVDNCLSHDNVDQVSCMAAATTYEQVHGCAESEAEYQSHH